MSRRKSIRRVAVTVSLSIIVSACSSLERDMTHRPSSFDHDAASEALDKADKHLEAGSYAKALAISRIVLAQNVSDVDANRIAGIASLALDELDDAEAYLSYSHAQQPSAETEGLLGLAYWRNKRAEDAKPFLMSALAQDRSRWREAFALGDIALMNGDPTGALEYLSLASAADGDSGRISLARGQALLALRRHADAVTALNESAAATNARLGRDLTYRLALAGAGRVDDALREAGDVETARVYRYLGRLAIESGRRQEAISNLKRAQAAAPRLDPETQRLMDAALALETPPK